jgi:transposase-like protein
VELVIHSARTQAQIARALGVSEYSLRLWKRAYLGHLKPAQVGAEQMSPQEMFDKIRQLQKENEYLERQ